jgi:hypothetical protein
MCAVSFFCFPICRFLTLGICDISCHSQYWYKLIWDDGEMIGEDCVNDLTPVTQVATFRQQVHAQNPKLKDNSIGAGELKVTKFLLTLFYFAFLTHGYFCWC